MISFYYVNKVKNWALFEKIEHVYFEKWKIPIIVLKKTPEPLADRDIKSGVDQLGRIILNIIEVQLFWFASLLEALCYDFSIPTTIDRILLQIMFLSWILSSK